MDSAKSPGVVEVGFIVPFIFHELCVLGLLRRCRVAKSPPPGWRIGPPKAKRKRRPIME